MELTPLDSVRLQFWDGMRSILDDAGTAFVGMVRDPANHPWDTGVALSAIAAAAILSEYTDHQRDAGIVEVLAAAYLPTTQERLLEDWSFPTRLNEEDPDMEFLALLNVARVLPELPGAADFLQRKEQVAEQHPGNWKCMAGLHLILEGHPVQSDLALTSWMKGMPSEDAVRLLQALAVP